MRPLNGTAAHQTDGLAELVCSNSFRSDDRDSNAVGLLHAEMRRLGSLIMRAADANQVPAGGALAVDRDGFSEAVTAALALASPGRDPSRRIDRYRRRIGTASSSPPARSLRRRLSDAIGRLTGDDALAFFDAIAPIVHRDMHRHVDRLVPVALRQGRPRRHRRRLHQLPHGSRPISGVRRCIARGRQDQLPRLGGTTPYFDGCLPIEVMAERGPETLRHGPMKPFGLTNPHQPQTEALRCRPTPPGQ